MRLEPQLNGRPLFQQRNCLAVTEPCAVLAIRGKKTLLVAQPGRMLELGLSDGSSISECGSLGDRQGQYDNPSALAHDALTSLYVCDCRNHRIQKLQLAVEAGTSLPATVVRMAYGCGKVRGRGFGDGIKRPDLHRPFGIAVCSSGPHSHSIFVSDGHDRVMVYGAEWLEPRMCIGRTGTRPGFFKGPTGLAVYEDDQQKVLVVCDTGNNRLQIFNLAESSQRCRLVRTIGDADEEQELASMNLFVYGSSGPPPRRNLFNSPRAVTVAPSRICFVADGGQLSSRVLALTLRGELLQTITMRGFIRSLSSTNHRLLATDSLSHAVRVFTLLDAAAGVRIPPAPKRTASVHPEPLPSSVATTMSESKPTGKQRWKSMSEDFQAGSILAAWRAPSSEAKVVQDVVITDVVEDAPAAVKGATASEGGPGKKVRGSRWAALSEEFREGRPTPLVSVAWGNVLAKSAEQARHEEWQARHEARQE